MNYPPHRTHDLTEHDHTHGDGCGHRAVPHDNTWTTCMTGTGTRPTPGTTTSISTSTTDHTRPSGSPPHQAGLHRVARVGDPSRRRVARSAASPAAATCRLGGTIDGRGPTLRMCELFSPTLVALLAQLWADRPRAMTGGSVVGVGIHECQLEPAGCPWRSGSAVAVRHGRLHRSSTFARGPRLMSPCPILAGHPLGRGQLQRRTGSDRSGLRCQVTVIIGSCVSASCPPINRKPPWGWTTS